MKILIDIGHPAHVHLFKHFAWEMTKRGHEILFTVRDKEHEIDLLKIFGFKYVSFGNHYKSILGKLLGMFVFDIKLLRTSITFKPDILLSHGSIYAAQVSWLIGKPHLSLEDSGNMEQIRLYRPFTDAIITPNCLPEDLGAKQIRYNSYHEMAYLHPNYFNPDPSIFKDLNLKYGEKYCILRFVSWNATHDEGHQGFSDVQKISVVKMISNFMHVFISAESDLPDELRNYKLSIPPEKIHNALYFASLHVGEGATMASESGVLGTTAVYINSIRRSYCEDQEPLGLIYNFQKPQLAINKIEQLLSDVRKLEKQEGSRALLLEKKIDLTAFLIWFVENYPASFKIMKEAPDYQDGFK